MSGWKGKITKKTSTDWNGTMLHSFQIEETQRWFRTGKEEIPFKEGDVVVFEERNGKVEASKVKDSSDVPTSTAPNGSDSEVSASPVGVKVIGRDEYWTRRERRDIEWEDRRRTSAARADAVRIVCAALAHDHLPHAANVAKGKRLDLLVGYVNEITHTLLEAENAE